jgi:hypothetical protein
LQAADSIEEERLRTIYLTSEGYPLLLFGRQTIEIHRAPTLRFKPCIGQMEEFQVKP